MIQVTARCQINPDEIVFFEAYVNYTIAHYSNGRRQVIVKPLKHIQMYVEFMGFYRIHKSYLINLDYVKEKPDAMKLIELKDNATLTVSRRKIAGLRKKLKQVQLQQRQENRKFEI
ncbi:LytR/AlgR family response regulator transcription factor [Emticicia sp. 17c]|uniref:LytR/AlgR family response regulator transcription factor n=1 Tax=Emticicia sp. 17c TaxID=3127704 RepID=UPI00301BCD46